MKLQTEDVCEIVIAVCVVLAFMCFAVWMPWAVMCGKPGNQSIHVCAWANHDRDAYDTSK